MVARSRGRRGFSRLALGISVSDHQAYLDLFLCARDGRIECDLTRSFLSGHRCLGLAEMGDALCLDRDESDYDLSDVQLYERWESGSPFCWRRYSEVFK